MGWAFDLYPIPSDEAIGNVHANHSTMDRVNIFYAGDSLAFALNGGPFTGTTYEVRDYYGDVVDSGNADVTPGTDLVIADLPPGWYRLYLWRATPITGWGRSQGGAMFVVWRDTPGFHAKPATGDTLTNNQYNNIVVLRSAMLGGPERQGIENAADPNGAVLARIDSARADVDLAKDWYLPFDTARPKGLLLHFPSYSNASGENAGVTTTVNALKPDVQYWEGRNEPDIGGYSTGAALVALQTAFHDTVKAAYPDAKVLGPAVVAINGATIAHFDEALTSGLGDVVDALSFHIYNAVNGDLTLARKVFSRFVGMLHAHGVDSLERWVTEIGIFAANYGLFQPRLQARWIMTELLVLEQYGIPKERWSYFYDNSHGFWDYPSFWSTGVFTLAPPVALIRVWSEELHGKTHHSPYSFGTVEDRWTLGSRFEAEDGSAVAALMSAGRTDQSVTLSVQGASSLTVVSPFGVESVATVVAGRVSVPVENGIPTYVRIPAGVTVRTIAGSYGPDLCRGKTVTTSGSGARAAQVTDGDWESWYDRLLGDAASDTTAPFIDDTASFPAWVEVDFGVSTTIDTVVISCPPPWQNQGTLLDFDVKLDGVTIGTITEPINTVAAVASDALFCCKAESYFSDRCVFVLTFAPTSVTKVRIHVRNVTFGGVPDATAAAAGGQAGAQKIVLRAIEAYNRSALPTPKYGARVA